MTMTAHYHPAFASGNRAAEIDIYKTGARNCRHLLVQGKKQTLIARGICCPAHLLLLDFSSQRWLAGGSAAAPRLAPLDGSGSATCQRRL